MVDKIQDVLNQIEQLQQTEEQLYKALTQNADHVAMGKKNTFTDSEIKNITTQINSLTTSRVNLYNFLSNSYHSDIEIAKTSKNSMKQQTDTLRILERELNKSKNNLAKLEDEKYNQLKMIEINTYASKQYDAQKRFMKLITIIGVCMLLSLLLSYIEALKSTSAFLFKLVTIIGAFFIIKQLIDMYLRRNDNYDEYTWPIAPTTDDGLTKSNEPPSFLDISGVDIGKLCVGPLCCSEGTVWDNENGCVLNN